MKRLFTSPYPISKVCPECGSKRFRTAIPHHMALDSDRVCKECGTRYTAPLPVWGPYVMLLSGIMFAGGAIGLEYDQHVSHLLGIKLYPWGAALMVVMGVYMIYLGMRWIIRGGDSFVTGQEDSQSSDDE